MGEINVTSLGWALSRKMLGDFPPAPPPAIHSLPPFELRLLQGKPRLLLTFSNNPNNVQHAPARMRALSLVLHLSRLQFIYPSPGIDLKSNFHLACIFWLHFPFLWLLFNVQAHCLDTARAVTDTEMTCLVVTSMQLISRIEFSPLK